MTLKIRHQLHIMTLAAVIVSIGGISGCATTSRVDELQAQVNALANDVAEAKSDAAAANSKANEALNTANTAANTANEANRRSYETEEKIDRMFKKAMHK